MSFRQPIKTQQTAYSKSVKFQDHILPRKNSYSIKSNIRERRRSTQSALLYSQFISPFKRRKSSELFLTNLRNSTILRNNKINQAMQQQVIETFVKENQQKQLKKMQQNIKNTSILKKYKALHRKTHRRQPTLVSKQSIEDCLQIVECSNQALGHKIQNQQKAIVKVENKERDTKKSLNQQIEHLNKLTIINRSLSTNTAKQYKQQLKRKYLSRRSLRNKSAVMNNSLVGDQQIQIIAYHSNQKKQELKNALNWFKINLPPRPPSANLHIKISSPPHQKKQLSSKSQVDRQWKQINAWQSEMGQVEKQYQF